MYIYIYIYIGSFNGEINVLGDKELGKNTKYEFILHPTPDFILNSVLYIIFPEEMSVGESCRCSIIESICSITPRREIRIENALSNPEVRFSLEVIKNPIYPCAPRDLVIIVEAKDIYNSREVIYQSENMGINTPGYYDAHPLKSMSVDASLYTVTSSIYQFSFINYQYPIPLGSVIRIQFPSTLQLIGTPVLMHPINLHPAAIPIYDKDNNYCIISMGFATPLIEDQLIQFSVGYILNPYILGYTDTFNVGIYVDEDPNLQIFHTPISDLNRILITEIAEFPSVTIIPDSEMTNELTNYTFLIGIGSGGLNSSHVIQYQPPVDIESCNIDTITPISPNIIVGNKHYNSPNNYSFGVGGFVTPNTNIEFKVECRNPYTTRPSNVFKLWAFDGNGNQFYNGTANIPTMTQINNLYSFAFSMENIYPRAINTYTFIAIPTFSYATTAIDQIQLINQGTHLELLGCALTNIIGISGTLICNSLDNIITISGITLLDSPFQFNLVNTLRNPPSHIYPISFTLITKHSEGYLGENVTSSIKYISCKFPCKTCKDSDPDECLSCFSDNNEVFTTSGVNTYLWHMDEYQCIDICPIYTYMETLMACKSILYCIYTYVDCYQTCAECDNGTIAGCTKCIPAFLILNTHECIENCPPETFYNDAELICQSIVNIYIYIECDFRCGHCDGPTNQNCSYCSKGDKIETSFDGSCNCLEGYFPIYNTYLDTYYCDGTNDNLY